MVDFSCIFFFWGDVTRRLVIRLGFLLDLLIFFPAILFEFFLYVNSDLLKKM